LDHLVGAQEQHLRDRTNRDDNADFALEQFSRKIGQPRDATVGESIINDEGLTL